MSTEKQTKLIGEYNALQRKMDLERTKAGADEFTIYECEDKMAAIETEFQSAGLDIRTFL